MAKKKRNFYFPPKATTRVKSDDVGVSPEVKAKLEAIAIQMADAEQSRRSAEDLNNYMAFSAEALNRMGFGQIRINRFLAYLTQVSTEVSSADDAPAAATAIKERMAKKGVVAFIKNDDTEQEEGVDN